MLYQPGGHETVRNKANGEFISAVYVNTHVENQPFALTINSIAYSRQSLNSKQIKIV